MKNNIEDGIPKKKRLINSLEIAGNLEWITVGGKHIPIKPGQSKDEAVKSALKNIEGGKADELTKGEEQPTKGAAVDEHKKTIKMPEERYNEIREKKLIRTLSDEEFEDFEKIMDGKEIEIEKQAIGAEPSKTKFKIGFFENVKSTEKVVEEELGKKGFSTIVKTDKRMYKVTRRGQVDVFMYGKWKRLE